MRLRQLTLLHYGEYNPLITENLIYLILLEKPNRQVGITKLEKLSSNILLKFLKKSEDIVFQYRHGLIPLDVDKTLAELIHRGIVDVIEKDKRKYIILTEEGIKYVKNAILPRLSEHPIFDNVVEEIRNLYLKPTEELIKMAYERASHLRYFVKYIGDRKIAYIFDWSEYGDGLIRPYHISLLFAFAHYETYFKEIQMKLPASVRINIDDIREVIYSNELIKKSGKKRLILLPEIFQKKDPPFLTEDKEEGKNYIANLWMIVEAINIFHVLLGMAPNIDELGTICLKDIFFGKKMELNNFSKEELRKLKEKVLRNDLKKLVEWGIVEQIKYNTKKRDVRYKLAARKYVDYYLGKEFKVLDKDVLWDLYNGRIRPVVKSDLSKK